MQFGINKHKQIFQRLQKLHEPLGRVQFVVFEKFASAYMYLFQIAQEKSFDYLFINKYTSNNFFHASVFTWQIEATSYFNFIGWKIDMRIQV